MHIAKRNEAAARDHTCESSLWTDITSKEEICIFPGEMSCASAEVILQMRVAWLVAQVECVGLWTPPRVLLCVFLCCVLEDRRSPSRIANHIR